MLDAFIETCAGTPPPTTQREAVAARVTATTATTATLPPTKESETETEAVATRHNYNHNKERGNEIRGDRGASGSLEVGAV